MSAAAGGGEPVLLPMGVQLLDAVMAIEVRAYPFPWSRGNFVDSIAAGYLTRCLVSPEHQGRGLARQLMQALREHAETEGADCLWLEVRPSNHRARALYARLGYAQVGVRRDYYPDAGGRREDALVLCLELQPGAAG